MNSNNIIIDRRNDKGELIGVSIINGNTILLLCVDQEYRSQGIGSDFPSVNEKLYHNIDEAACEFFNKRGYRHSWDCNCFDMRFSLADYKDAMCLLHDGNKRFARKLNV